VRGHDQRSIIIEQVSEEHALKMRVKVRLGLLHSEDGGNDLLRRLLRGNLLKQKGEVEQVRSAEAGLADCPLLGFIDEQPDGPNELFGVGRGDAESCRDGEHVAHHVAQPVGDPSVDRGDPVVRSKASPASPIPACAVVSCAGSKSTRARSRRSGERAEARSLSASRRAGRTRMET
jgi:hypothetical protein